jgi:hypothetical protein
LPYFTFIPWDYHNSLGIDYFGVQWQDTDIVDWSRNTINYWRTQRTQGSRTATSPIPLVQNLLRNRDFLQYYLDHVEHLLDTEFNPGAIAAEIGADGGGLWDRVCQAAYLESDTPDGSPFTGRQFSNDEVYRVVHEQKEVRRGATTIEGILHYVSMRYDSASGPVRVGALHTAHRGPREGSPLRRRRSVAGAGQRRLSRTGPSDVVIEEWTPEPSLMT